MNCDKVRMCNNIDKLNSWLQNKSLTIYNEFTNTYEHIRHLKVVDNDIENKLNKDHKFVELSCTGKINVYTVFEDVFLSLIVKKQLLEQLDKFDSSLFKIKDITHYKHAIYFDVEDCGNVCLNSI